MMILASSTFFFCLHHHFYFFCTHRIGLAIARRLGQDGAKVVVSSRKQNKVDKAVALLKDENIEVYGVAAHAGKDEDRVRLVQQVLKDFLCIENDCNSVMGCCKKT